MESIGEVVPWIAPSIAGSAVESIGEVVPWIAPSIVGSAWPAVESIGEAVPSIVGSASPPVGTSNNKSKQCNFNVLIKRLRIYDEEVKGLKEERKR